MDYVGLATIFKKRMHCIGFYYDFSNSGRNFIVLIGKLAGETLVLKLLRTFVLKIIVYIIMINLWVNITLMTLIILSQE